MVGLPRKDELNHSVSRTLAATLGTIPVALALGIALACALPLPTSLSLTVGSYSVFPIWVTAACFSFLARSARRAWLSLLWTLLLAALIACLALISGRAQQFGWGNR